MPITPEMTAVAKPRLVVVGNGMAGMRTVDELLALAPDRYDITVIGREPHGSYNRIMLSPVLAGDKPFDDIVTHTPDWYAERGIRLLSGQTVVNVDRRRREVITDQGVRAGYERLLLATGSQSFMLPVPGADHPDVIGFRDLADVRRMQALKAGGQRVAVIGGGLLGLEAAWGLVRQGIPATVIHGAEFLLNRQLDAEAAGLLLQALVARGIAFRLHARTTEIVHDAQGRLQGVRFSDGSLCPADLVVMAVGIRPQVALARQIGLQVDQAILVNDTLQTFDPRIYAVGECVQHRGSLFGLVAPLYEQARICAMHLAETGTGRYVQKPVATTLKVSGIELFSAGDFNQPGAEQVVFRAPRQGIYKKLCLQGDRLVGTVLYGDTQDGAWYFDLIRQGVSVAGWRDQLMFGRVPALDALLAGAA